MWTRKVTVSGVRSAFSGLAVSWVVFVVSFQFSVIVLLLFVGSVACVVGVVLLCASVLCCF